MTPTAAPPTLTADLPDRKTDRASIEFVPGEFPQCGMLTVIRTTGKRTQKTTRHTYLVYFLDADASGRTYRFRKPAGETGTDPEADTYDVHCGSDAALVPDRCHCRGRLRWGHCRHVDSADVMVALGWI